ncbi:MAG: hypothetical protein ACOCYV_02415 [Planctomycetota bacterium]
MSDLSPLHVCARLAAAARAVLGVASCYVARFTRSPWALAAMRRITGIQMRTAEIGAVAACFGSASRRRLLVFGLGNDALFWHLLAPRSAVFLEDNAFWLGRSRRRSSLLRIHPVRYGTTIERIDSPPRPRHAPLVRPALPPPRHYDVVVVDAPAGNVPGTPGRGQSLALAARSVRADGVVFLHDASRPIEHALVDRLFPDCPLRYVGDLAMIGPPAVAQDRAA